MRYSASRESQISYHAALQHRVLDWEPTSGTFGAEPERDRRGTTVALRVAAATAASAASCFTHGGAARSACCAAASADSPFSSGRTHMAQAYSPPGTRYSL
mmetsp:Transcript_12315/g.32223  ORF Transcript_12315/g.32223 Transcript_12315/m.32223 type:complete len:101 (+) Transcript_12315:33-335(+)